MGRESPEWLPTGWKVSVRVRSSGKKDKYYVNPSKGLKFNSKPEVLRHLEISGEYLNKSPAEAQGNGLIDKKTHKSLSGHDTGMSESEVAMHLEQTSTDKVHMTVCSSLEQRKEGNSSPVKLSNKRQLRNGVKQTRGKRVSVNIKVDKNKVEDQTPKSEHRGCESGSLPSKMDQPNVKDRYKDGRRQSPRLAESKLKVIKFAAEDQSIISGPRLDLGEEKTISIAETNGLDQREGSKSTGKQHHEDPVGQSKEKCSKKKWASVMPRRTSKRLAHEEVDLSLELKTRKRGGNKSSKVSGEAKVNTTENISKSGLSDELETNAKDEVLDGSNNEHSVKCITGNAANYVQNRPNCLEDHKVGLGGTGIGMDIPEKQFNSNLNDLLMDPCIEFAIKTLTGAIPIEDMTKVSDSPVSSLASLNQTSASSSISPSVSVWDDPCFEFAVKTLTGEMPTRNGSQLQITFQQPLSSSKFRLDNMCPSNESFSLSSGVKKPYL